MENITFYYREGSTDKVYQASIEPKGCGYAVNFAYGRRGATLQTGSKTSTPVPYDQAKAIYDKLVREKTAKGYTRGESGTPYQHTEKQNQSTGILPQLLNSIRQEDVAQLIYHSSWAVQEKFDGRRMLLRRRPEGIDGINRNGLITALPEPVVRAAEALPGTFILDGECIGDQLVVFDLLEWNGQDFRSKPYHVRLLVLMDWVPAKALHLRAVGTAFKSSDKAALVDRLRKENKEGVVFKRLDASHSSGRPASGGDALKFKFVETASFIVAKVNAKRSVSLSLWDGSGQLQPAGNVTVPPNHVLPQPGSVVGCRYLYAFKESGSIYQPVYLGLRDDIPTEECTTQQLKFKSTEEAEALQAAA